MTSVFMKMMPAQNRQDPAAVSRDIPDTIRHHVPGEPSGKKILGSGMRNKKQIIEEYHVTTTRGTTHTNP